MSTHLVGYLEFTTIVLGKIQGRDLDILEWVISTVGTYKDLQKLGK
jgi:hypothetical protein